MNSISNISILPEINSTSIWHTLVDNVLNGIAYLFAAILSTRARKIETALWGEYPKVCVNLQTDVR